MKGANKDAKKANKNIQQKYFSGVITKSEGYKRVQIIEALLLQKVASLTIMSYF